MNVSLTPELEKLIQEKVASGHYQTASEVVRESLRLLAERDRLRALEHKELKRQIAVGLKAARKGDLTPGGKIFDELRRASRARRRRQG
jgi:antitoxin ParD1/3/4